MAYKTAVAIGMGPQGVGGEVERRLVWALNQVMNQGSNSTILALEQEWLVPNGVPQTPNADLADTVAALSTFGVPPAADAGAVWRPAE